MDCQLESLCLRRNRLYLPEREKVNSPKLQEVGTLLKNIEELGFTLNEGAIQILLYCKDINRIHDNLLSNLIRLTKTDRSWDPMYPNFPRQVMEATEAELFINALVHYIGDYIGVRIMPSYEKEPRSPFKEVTKLTVLGIVDDSYLSSLSQSLISSKSSLSDQEKEELVVLIKSGYSKLPERFEHKEVQALVLATYIKMKEIESIYDYVSSPTDVLRVAIALSDGDISLSTPSKFKSFPRRERRILLEGLNKEAAQYEAFNRREQFLRLGERLHPGEYKSNYVIARRLFDSLRSRETIVPERNKIDQFIQNGGTSFNQIKSILEANPGVFARRLDVLVRSLPEEEDFVLESFESIASKVPVTILLSLQAHFSERNSSKPARIFFPKGNIAKMFVKEEILDPLPKEVCSRISSICKQAMIDRFSKLPPLGTVRIDPKLSNYAVPLGMRSASKAFKTVARGSRFNLDPSKTIRFFLWWKDGEERTDIDLSLLLMDDEFNKVETISYTNLRNEDLGCCHSGDITSAPSGACEFIDVNIPKIINSKVRYITMIAFSFSGQRYCDLPECFVGWEEREETQSGEIFEARAVKNRIDLTSDTKISIPVLIDLEEEYILWTDLALKNNPLFANNIENNEKSVNVLTRGIINKKFPMLSDLLELHSRARGSLIEDNDSTFQTEFSAEDGFQFELEKIRSDFL